LILAPMKIRAAVSPRLCGSLLVTALKKLEGPSQYCSARQL